MGSQMSKERRVASEKVISDPSLTGSTSRTDPPSTLDEHRIDRLMQGLKEVLKLQEEAVDSQIDQRQKYREVGFLRREVGTCDDNFMKVVQRFDTEGRFDGFGELKALASKCQEARDELGTVEQEGMISEQKWEGHIWELQVAEKQLTKEFASEFKTSKAYLPSHHSASEEYSANFESGPTTTHGCSKHDFGIAVRPLGSAASQPSLISNIPDANSAEGIQLSTSKQTDLLGIMQIPSVATGDFSSNLDQGSPEDIDVLFGSEDVRWKTLDSRNMSAEYVELLVDEFQTKRERVNRWLEHMALTSRFESLSLFTILKAKLDQEDAACPSNWAQIVLAYWAQVQVNSRETLDIG